MAYNFQTLCIQLSMREEGKIHVLYVFLLSVSLSVNVRSEAIIHGLHEDFQNSVHAVVCLGKVPGQPVLNSVRPTVYLGRIGLYFLNSVLNRGETGWIVRAVINLWALEDAGEMFLWAAIARMRFHVAIIITG